MGFLSKGTADSDPCPEYTVCTVYNKDDILYTKETRPFLRTLVGTEPITWLVDTGAGISVMSSKTYQSIEAYTSVGAAGSSSKESRRTSESRGAGQRSRESGGSRRGSRGGETPGSGQRRESRREESTRGRPHRRSESSRRRSESEKSGGESKESVFSRLGPKDKDKDDSEEETPRRTTRSSRQ